MTGGLVRKRLQGLNATRTDNLYSPHACRTEKMKRTESIWKPGRAAACWVPILRHGV